MFCNTCILFFDLSFFGLGPEVESDQVAQPLALLCPPNLARKDKEWMHVGSKWRCKVGTCTIAYCAKWLLTKHLEEMHGLVAKKAKPGRSSTSRPCQDECSHLGKCDGCAKAERSKGG